MPSLPELYWADIAECRVTSFAVVKTLDIVEYLGLDVGSRAVDLAVSALDLERLEAALHHRIVPAVARPAHAAGDAQFA